MRDAVRNMTGKTTSYKNTCSFSSLSTLFKVPQKVSSHLIVIFSLPSKNDVHFQSCLANIGTIA